MTGETCAAPLSFGDDLVALSDQGSTPSVPEMPREGPEEDGWWNLRQRFSGEGLPGQPCLPTAPGVGTHRSAIDRSHVASRRDPQGRALRTRLLSVDAKTVIERRSLERPSCLPLSASLKSRALTNPPTRMAGFPRPEKTPHIQGSDDSAC
jgi:hypothetical protein